MDIIHDMNDYPLPRLAGAQLVERLEVLPALVLTGARQTGKSTLVQTLLEGTGRYYTLDDLEVLDLADRDPAALLGGDNRVFLDEVQRKPDILLAVKQAIDANRLPGRFILTGSANLLLMNRTSESLAGRASYLTLWPMTRREQLGQGRGGLWSELLSAKEADWPALLTQEQPYYEDWQELALRGGYPTPALDLKNARARTVWFEGYVRTYLERDLQDLSAITSLLDFRRLLRAGALRLGQLLNQTELGRDISVPQPTVHRWLNLLEASYLVVRLPAYSVNRTKRLVKSPKLYWNDTGLALHLAGNSKPTGAHLENLILSDLIAWKDASLEHAELGYWRTTGGDEVDLVIESDGGLLPIEVKSTDRPRLADARHLLTFRAEYGAQSRAGLLLHTGDRLEWLADGILAAPWWRVI